MRKISAPLFVKKDYRAGLSNPNKLEVTSGRKILRLIIQNGAEFPANRVPITLYFPEKMTHQVIGHLKEEFSRQGSCPREVEPLEFVLFLGSEPVKLKLIGLRFIEEQFESHGEAHYVFPGILGKEGITLLGIKVGKHLYMINVTTGR